MKLIAIDPGPSESGICVIDSESYRPLNAGKTQNELILDKLELPSETKELHVVIEMVGHYGTGMPAGSAVFDTCVWIGRYMQWFLDSGISVSLMMRMDVKMNLCGTSRAKDSNIRQALVDRFAPTTKNYGKGTMKDPGFFYGFAADMWQAYALGVTYLDKEKV